MRLKKLLLCLFLLLPALCLLSCSKQSVRVEPYAVLMVFHDPQCEYCKRDEPIVDSMQDGIDMIFLSWGDRDEVGYYNVRSVPTYVLLMDKSGFMLEVWRTNSAAEARDRLGLSP